MRCFTSQRPGLWILIVSRFLAFFLCFDFAFFLCFFGVFFLLFFPLLFHLLVQAISHYIGCIQSDNFSWPAVTKRRPDTCIGVPGSLYDLSGPF